MKTIRFYSREYKVEVKAGLTYQGDRCDGLTLFEPAKILISRDLSPADRISTLFHEAWHVFRRETPGNLVTEEDECEAAGIVGLTVVDALSHGVLPPIESTYRRTDATRKDAIRTGTDARRTDAAILAAGINHKCEGKWVSDNVHMVNLKPILPPQTVQCARCEKPFNAPVSVVSSPSRWSDEFERFLMRRRLYCDHCNHIQTWTEITTPTGRPTGETLGDVRFQRGKAVGRFIEAHPIAANHP